MISLLKWLKEILSFNENNTPIGLNTFKSIDKTIVNSINRAKEIKKDEKVT